VRETRGLAAPHFGADRRTGTSLWARRERREPKGLPLASQVFPVWGQG